MNLKSSKTIGGIGAILMVISVLPYISQLPFIGLIGAILVLVGFHELRVSTKKEESTTMHSTE